MEARDPGLGKNGPWEEKYEGEGMGRDQGMKAEERREKVRRLDQASMAFGVAGRAAVGVDGWLRAVRQALNLPTPEMAKRMGVVESAVFRAEQAERKGAIQLETLRAEAKALRCELVYGLVPATGTLEAMAAKLEAGRKKRRAAAYALKLEKSKSKRREAAKKEWQEQHRWAQEAKWRKYWEAWYVGGSEFRRIRPPAAVRETPWWREMMRRALKAALRKEGIRLR